MHLNDIRGITIHITEPKIPISYSKNHDSTILLLFLYVTPSNLAHAIAKHITFSISSRFDVTKLQKKNVLMSHRLAVFIPNVNGKAYSYPIPPLWQWGSLNLDLNDIERVIIHLSVPENYGFDIIYQ